MSARNIFEDIDRFKQLTDSNVAMLATMHAGLSEIAKCKPTPGGSEAMKHIAEITLNKVEKIAAQLEVANA